MKYYQDEKIMIGLSGGINSMAVLCWLFENKIQPQELHLFYAHLVEHSPDTFQFVADGIRFARKHFNNVKVKITRNSVLQFFEQQKMIPHPMFSPCTRVLKIEPMITYGFENGIKYDLVGYIQHELKRRSKKQKEVAQADLFSLVKEYPIGLFNDEWCFEIVDKYIGWHPKIYDLKDESGRRLFDHNNCLPCKNFYPEHIENVRVHYPDYFHNAMGLSRKLQKHWGRDKTDFYTTFGRELGQEVTCTSCKW